MMVGSSVVVVVVDGGIAVDGIGFIELLVVVVIVGLLRVVVVGEFIFVFVVLGGGRRAMVLCFNKYL
jgi:hypothetical protein